jgi:hypothetical protein
MTRFSVPGEFRNKVVWQVSSTLIHFPCTIDIPKCLHRAAGKVAPKTDSGENGRLNLSFLPLYAA